MTGLPYSFSSLKSDFRQIAFEIGREPEVEMSFAIVDQDIRVLIVAADEIVSAETGAALALALEGNLRLWIGIRTLVTDTAGGLPAEVRANLIELADFVTATTLGVGRGILDDSQIESLVAINLHIAQGLINGQRTRLIRERAFELWELAGRPEGTDLEHWLVAEREIGAALAPAGL